MNTLRLLFLVSYLLLTCIVSTYGQRFVIESGSVGFFSKSAIEDIKSENKKVKSIFNLSTGSVAFSMLIHEFKFHKQLMEEHFNDKYMESHKFPAATFAGTITGYDVKQSGVQNVQAKGKMTIHGIAKDVDISGTFELNGTHITLKSTFKIKLADYEIKIPQLLWRNIAEQVDVTLNLIYKQQ